MGETKYHDDNPSLIDRKTNELRGRPSASFIPRFRSYPLRPRPVEGGSRWTGRKLSGKAPGGFLPGPSTCRSGRDFLSSSLGRKDLAKAGEVRPPSFRAPRQARRRGRYWMVGRWVRPPSCGAPRQAVASGEALDDGAVVDGEVLERVGVGASREDFEGLHQAGAGAVEVGVAVGGVHTGGRR